MKAAQYSQFGGPEVLEVAEVDEPHAGPGQIRVAVRAAGINPVDWKMRRGIDGRRSARSHRARGSRRGRRARRGRHATWRSAMRCSGLPTAAGASPRRSCSSTTPASLGRLDFAAAAALPVAVETAVRTLDAVGVGEGTTVLVNGAAGAVGSAAVQIAVSRGARVIGTASPNNHDYLRSLGAEPTTYGEGLAQRVRELAPDGVDAAVDAAGGGALPDLVQLAGGPQHVVTIADYAGAQQTGVTFSGGMGTSRAVHALSEIGELIDSGRFTLPVAQTFPLDQISEAHRLSETGHVRGKLVVLLDD